MVFPSIFHEENQECVGREHSSLPHDMNKNVAKLSIFFRSLLFTTTDRFETEVNCTGLFFLLWTQDQVRETRSFQRALRYQSFWNPCITSLMSHIVVQLLSGVQLFVTPWTAVCSASLSYTISWSLLQLISIESTMPSNCLILCHPLLLPSVFPSIRVFLNESALCIRWPKYLSFSFSISPSSEYSGLISFRIDWFDLLEVQGTLKSLLQHYSLKASVLRHSAFFMVQLSAIHDYWKNHSFDFTHFCQQSDVSAF